MTIFREFGTEEENMFIRKSTAALTAALLLFSVIPQNAAAEETAHGFALEQHTAREIRAFFASHPWEMQNRTVYAETPSLTAPYSAGALSEETQQEALNCINCIRYTAGLPADLTVKEEYAELAQAAALVNCLNGVLDHTPEKPGGMDEPLFQLGKLGSGSSNLSKGRSALCQSVIQGFIGDSDDKNLPVLGHRRWILNPELLYTGFGQTERYYAVYVHDFNRKEPFTGDYIAWPPQNMLYFLYSSGGRYAFSVSLGSRYDTADPGTVTVDIRSEALGTTYHLDGNCTDFSYYLRVSTEMYGIPNCLIFYPGQIFPENDTVTVSISGITKNGEPAPISYTISFFTMDPKMRGDCNLDGDVSVDDAQAALTAYTETVAGKADGLNAAQRRTADVNEDSCVSVEDAQYILKYYVSNSVAGSGLKWEELLGQA